jgi:hypothetical protein
LFLKQSRANEPEQVILRTSIKTEGTIWVGQRVLLLLDVLVSEGWAQIKNVPAFEVAGAYVLRLQSQGTRLNETIKGNSYSGQRYEFSIFPQRGGDISVPSVLIEVEIKRWGSQANKQSEQLKTPPVEFRAQVPQGTEGIQGLISTTGLKARQSWEPDSREFKVGDAIKRVIFFSAEDVAGLAFTPLRFPPHESLGIYSGEPTVEDSYNRGVLTGKRTETVTYVFENEGKVELPEIVITWWDLKNKKLRQERLPALELNIDSSAIIASATIESDASEKKTLLTPRFLIVTIILISLLGFFLRFRNAIQSRWKTWQHHRNETERAYFHRFKKASRSGDPVATTNCLMRWLDRIHPDTGTARLDQFLNKFGDEKTRLEAERLFKSIKPGDKYKWDGSVLLSGLDLARQRWKQIQRKKEISYHILPPLNP